MRQAHATGLQQRTYCDSKVLNGLQSSASMGALGKLEQCSGLEMRAGHHQFLYVKLLVCFHGRGILSSAGTDHTQVS
jgi:hypothetical protein